MVSILYLHKDFSKEEHHGKVFKFQDMGSIGPGPKWAQGPKGPRPKWAPGPNGPGPNGPGPKWAWAQMGPGPHRDRINQMRTQGCDQSRPRPITSLGPIYLMTGASSDVAQTIVGTFPRFIQQQKCKNTRAAEGGRKAGRSKT